MIATLLSLAAQVDPALSLSVAIGLAGMLVGGALVFGAMRENVSQLKDAVAKLTEKVDELTAIVGELSAKIRETEAARKAVEAVTAKYDAAE